MMRGDTPPGAFQVLGEVWAVAKGDNLLDEGDVYHCRSSEAVDESLSS